MHFGKSFNSTGLCWVGPSGNRRRWSSDYHHRRTRGTIFNSKMLHKCPHALGDNSNPIDGHRWDRMESQHGGLKNNSSDSVALTCAISTITVTKCVRVVIESGTNSYRSRRSIKYSRAFSSCSLLLSFVLDFNNFKRSIWESARRLLISEGISTPGTLPLGLT